MQKTKQTKSLPEGFLWGAATSAHQVEGNNINNWSEWEKSPARIATIQKDHPSANLEEYFSGKAADHYNRYREDISLAKILGMNAYRFSIEWSRIEPEEGKFDQKEIKHYQDVVDYCISHGITPLVTLWHWTFPVWMEKYNLFESRKSVEFFTKYVKKTVTSLPQVKYWITINEPETYIYNSYVNKRWAPGKASWISAIRVFFNLVKSHKVAYSTIKQLNPISQVGFSVNNTYFEPGNKNLDTHLFIKTFGHINNFLFLNKTRGCFDFIGLNYYFRSKIVGFRQANENKITSDLGWELYPRGIYNVIANLKKYQKPIIITENGLADKNDTHRSWFIKETIEALIQASKDGHNIQGYLHWSLLDNFEWADGFAPRFGLIAVDYKTQRRTIRKSALLLKKLISSLS